MSSMTDLADGQRASQHPILKSRPGRRPPQTPGACGVTPGPTTGSPTTETSLGAAWPGPRMSALDMSPPLIRYNTSFAARTGFHVATMQMGSRARDLASTSSRESVVEGPEIPRLHFVMPLGYGIETHRPEADLLNPEVLHGIAMAGGIRIGLVFCSNDVLTAAKSICFLNKEVLAEIAK